MKQETRDHAGRRPRGGDKEWHMDPLYYSTSVSEHMIETFQAVSVGPTFCTLRERSVVSYRDTAGPPLFKGAGEFLRSRVSDPWLYYLKSSRQP